MGKVVTLPSMLDKSTGEYVFPVGNQQEHAGLSNMPNACHWWKHVTSVPGHNYHIMCAKIRQPCMQATTRSVLDWAVMANTYHLQKFLARCELFIMKHFHTNPSSKAFIAALSPESQLRVYRWGAPALRLTWLGYIALATRESA